jgi:hypothetical protein
MPFDKAAEYAWNRQLDVGYVLSADDPFTCVDFDVKDAQNAPNQPDKWTSQESMNLYYRLMEEFDSYTERSQSGKGYHTWIRGNIGRGVRQNGIEVYSQDRFIICTGNVAWQKPIGNRDLALFDLVNYLRPNRSEDIELDNLPAEMPSWQLIQTSLTAENGTKFEQLWQGDWKGLGYPSQSEADLALMSILTFYSKSNSLVRDTFRMSILGQREKATKNDDYINRTLKTIRARQKDEEEQIQLLMANGDALTSQWLDQQRLQKQIQEMEGSHNPVEIHPLHIPNQPDPVIPLQVPEAQFMAGAPITAEAYAAGNEGIPWPPGVAGHIARFIYESSYLSVKEVSIAATLGFLAGVCGKGWTIPLSGLNTYVILIAKSGIGKEGMHQGISFLVKAVTEKLPIFSNFVDFRDMASGPALTKACSENPCFLNVVGEWGKKLRRMAIETSGPMDTLRTAMINLYQKSGPSAIVGGIRYSQADKNIQSISGVSYSMVGESTPETFYQSLTEDMMEDGFLSRFVCIEYNGDRPMANPNIIQKPNDGLIELLAKIGTHADRTSKSLQSVISVQRTAEAARMINDFDNECRIKINATRDNSQRHMWNRASLKAQRIAALLAVLENFMFPCIIPEQVTWGMEVIRRDIDIMGRHITEGDVGVSDTSREKKILNIIDYYFANALSPTYANQQKFKVAGMIAYKYIQQHVGSSTAFKSAKMGTQHALNAALKSLIDSGNILELPKAEVGKRFQFNGRLFQVLEAPRSFQ